MIELSFFDSEYCPPRSETSLPEDSTVVDSVDDELAVSSDNTSEDTDAVIAVTVNAGLFFDVLFFIVNVYVPTGVERGIVNVMCCES